MNKYYPYEPVSIHTQSKINFIQDNNRLITKKVRVSLPLLNVNGEGVITIYGINYQSSRSKGKLTLNFGCIFIVDFCD